VSGHLVGQLRAGDRLHDVWFADPDFLILNATVVVIAAGFRMLRGEMLPQGGLPGELGVASGARDLHGGPGDRRGRRGRR